MQRTEAALANETAARERAERALQDAQAAVQALQTKIGHHELSRNEVESTNKRLLSEHAKLREDLAGGDDRIQSLERRAEAAELEAGTLRDELNEERRARKLAERLLRETTSEPARTPLVVANAEPDRPRRGRPPNVRRLPEPEPEGEPVKWWLTESETASRRR